MLVRERAIEEGWRRSSVFQNDSNQMNSAVSGVVVDAGEGGTSIIPVVWVAARW